MIYFKDKEGQELYDGCVVELTTIEKVGEKTTTYKRQKQTFSIREQVTALYIVRFGLFKSIQHSTILTWYLETDKDITYNTSFWAGVGTTKSERFANANREVSANLSRVLSEELARQCTVVKPISSTD